MLSLASFLVMSTWLSCLTIGQSDARLKPVVSLPAALPENSGLIELGGGEFLGNNDSGDGTYLYAFNVKTPSKARKIRITNAQHVDWEELAADEQYVYIGDMGNNDGDRRNLAIYKISKEEVRKRSEVAATKISFAYDRQQSFKASGKSNFDCEAMICVGDSLYLFSKNRGNLKTDAYSIPNVPGNYTAHHMGSFDAGGLVTSADFRKNGTDNELVLIGYISKDHSYEGFLIYFPHVQGTQFFNSTPRRIDFTTPMQIEAVLFHDLGSVYISNEQTKSHPGMLYRVDLPGK